MTEPYFQNESKNNQYLLGYRDGVANAGREWKYAMDNANLWSLNFMGRRLTSDVEQTPASATVIIQILREAAALVGNTISPRMHFLTVKHLAFYQVMFACYLIGNVLDAISQREWWFLGVAILAVCAQSFVSYTTWAGYKKAKAEIAAARRANDIDNEI